MSRRKPQPRSEPSGWTERDELQRLDLVAGVVAPTSLAGCVASAALIATGHLVDAANYVLGAAAGVLLGAAALAIFSLAWSPFEATKEGKSLEEVIHTKRKRTRVALAALVLSIIIGFGTTALLETADGADGGGKQKSAELRSRATYT